MPKQFHRSITIGEMTWQLRNTTSPVLYRHYQDKLIEKFRGEGYWKRILREIKSMSHNKWRQVLHKLKRKRHMERPIPFVTTFEYFKTTSSTVYCWKHCSSLIRTKDHSAAQCLLREESLIHNDKYPTWN